MDISLHKQLCVQHKVVLFVGACMQYDGVMHASRKKMLEFGNKFHHRILSETSTMVEYFMPLLTDIGSGKHAEALLQQIGDVIYCIHNCFVFLEPTVKDGIPGIIDEVYIHMHTLSIKKYSLVK